ncbi:MAG: molybdenum cofactor guanylyltransferase [Bacteroidales bacterium]
MAEILLTGIVLAGGKSSRMQTDKGFVSYKGKLLIEHALDQIRPFCEEILISANRNEYRRFGYPLIKDTIYGIGPIGGIYSSVQKCSNDLCFITACDILGINTGLVDEMTGKARGKELVCLKGKNDELQPLPVILHKNVLPCIEMQIERNDFRLQNFIHIFNEQNPDDSECVRKDIKLLNLNTMKDLEQ